MANLAIRGHATRGNEVAEILKMLGAKDTDDYKCTYTDRIYYVLFEGVYWDCFNPDLFDKYKIFTLEEFLEKYPYKVGDWVQHNGATSCDSVFDIEEMQWEGGTVKYIVKQLGCCGYGKKIKIAAEHLQPYKETYKEGKKKSLLASLIEYFRTTPKDELEREWNEHNELDKIGPTVEEYFAFVESIKKQSKYPKTYEECCYSGYDEEYTDKHLDLIRKFQKLKLCRDAYWKIAGEQMGL